MRRPRLVKPITCPKCDGTGWAPVPELAEAAQDARQATNTPPLGESPQDVPGEADTPLIDRPAYFNTDPEPPMRRKAQILGYTVTVQSPGYPPQLVEWIYLNLEAAEELRRSKERLASAYPEAFGYRMVYRVVEIRAWDPEGVSDE